MISENTELNTFAIIIGLAGGLALFLYGMEKMTRALKMVAGERMRRILGRLTTNRFSAAATGAFVTAMIQSSSVTTVLVVGFISAGLMSLTASVGVIMGANIGTTITAQIIAFKVTEYALLLVAGGFGLLFFSRNERASQIGALILGAGMIFLGMGLMSEATSPLRSYDPFIQVMKSLEQPLLAILAAAIFTAIIQSSSATTGMVIVLAGQGYITLETGIALALGANIGTCVTALLATLKKPRVALQAASVHVLFNVVGVLIWIGLIPLLADLVRSISPSHPELASAARLATETPRQIANAHTLFNMLNTLLFLPFTGLIAGTVRRLLPERPTPVPERARPLHLDEIYLETPALALDRLRLEIGHLGELVTDVLKKSGDGPGASTRAALAADVKDVETLHSTILKYARRLSRKELAGEQTRRFEALLSAANHILNISDTFAVNLQTMSRKWEKRGLNASDETQSKFAEFHSKVLETFVLALDAIRESDDEKARQVVGMKSEVVDLSDRLSSYLATRLVESSHKDVAVYRYENEMRELLKRVYYFSKRMAQTATLDLADSNSDDQQDENLIDSQ